MNILITPEWKEYELLDSGQGKRLERFGSYILVRPDPQAIWQPRLSEQEWLKADAVFEKRKEEKEQWYLRTSLPDKWKMSYGDLSFWVKLTPFKHTGVFPEQAVHWDWMRAKIQSAHRPTRILNLFGYTGLASLIAAQSGSSVTHLDASRPTIGWARENQELSGLSDKPIRWILDDASTFVQREIRRNVRYDGIIMDPPIYGHGPHGETWDFMKDFPLLLELCKQVLSDQPLFLICNAYAISASSMMLENMLSDLQLPGQIEAGEIALKESNRDRMLSTGIFARWSR